MSDLARVAPEADNPVNPYSLLEAVNSSSDTAHTAWLIFLGIMTYFVIAVAGVTHKDLLLETPVQLPILQVNIQLAQFFQFAPVILVLLHLGLVSQLVMLARKTLEFDHAIRMLEPSEKRTHPLRLELDNFFFVQAIAGPHRSAVMSTFLHGMSWLTIVILPVVVILYIQVVFLPYHDVSITWSHRIMLLIDMAMLVLIGIFLMRVETSFFQAFARTTTAHPFSFALTSLVLGIVALFSFLAATVPGEPLDRLGQAVFGSAPEREGRERPYFSGFVLPFFGARTDGTLLGIFHRNLSVPDLDLVVDKEVISPLEPSIILRGRDLRFAKLDRSDMHQADMTGANLDGASLIATDLRGAWLQCADLSTLVLSEDRERSKCTFARDANFFRTNLTDAHMNGIDLTGSRLEEARLDGAELAYAMLIGANFSNAHLEKSDITGGVQAQGANFLIANLQGADLTGAHLQGADFSSAAMQGSILNYAHLQGAKLRDADLEAASLLQTKLHGADLTGAKIAAVDLRQARVWQTTPPQADTAGLADFSEIAIAQLSDSDIAALNEALGRILTADVRTEVTDALAAIMNTDETPKWAGSADQQQWQQRAEAGAAVVQSPDYKQRLTEFLAAAMCRPRWSAGTVATGIARRAQTQQFRGDLVAINDRLRAAGCSPGQNVPARVLRDLATAADLARGP